MSLRAPSGERLYDSRELAGYDKTQLVDRDKNPKSYRILGNSVTPTEVLELRVRWFEQLPPMIDQWDVIKVHGGAQKMHQLLQDRKAVAKQLDDTSNFIPHFYQERSVNAVLNRRVELERTIAMHQAEMSRFVAASNKKYA
jgi:hypothetical protein